MGTMIQGGMLGAFLALMIPNAAALGFLISAVSAAFFQAMHFADSLARPGNSWYPSLWVWLAEIVPGALVCGFLGVILVFLVVVGADLLADLLGHLYGNSYDLLGTGPSSFLMPLSPRVVLGAAVGGIATGALWLDHVKDDGCLHEDRID